VRRIKVVRDWRRRWQLWESALALEMDLPAGVGQGLFTDWVVEA
jgi:hypothetical protein